MLLADDQRPRNKTQNSLHLSAELHSSCHTVLLQLQRVGLETGTQLCGLSSYSKIDQWETFCLHSQGLAPTKWENVT